WSIDHIRRLGRPGSPGRTAGEYEVDKLPSLSMRADMNVEVMALAECLERLSPRHRDAVLRAYYDGWSREELASHFDIPVNTIKAWLRRGLIALRRCMDGDTR
ncbi:MAG: sigma factor-like helix-turn-helix DNA-binding protein, partial [Paracoccaceae bacterium]